MRNKDANRIAFSILQQVTLTSPKPGETASERASRAGALLGGIRGGIAGSAALTMVQRKANGLKGAIARWGSIRERDNSHMPKKDINQLAYSIVRQATGEDPKPEEESAKAKAGRSGGVKGGAARAASLTPEERAEIAKKAAAARWKR